MHAMRGSFWKYGHAVIFGCSGIVLIVGMKEFGKFIWRDKEKELINIFIYVRKALCKCMKSAMRRHTRRMSKKQSTLLKSYRRWKTRRATQEYPSPVKFLLLFREI